MEWENLFSGRSLKSVRQARLDKYIKLYEVEFGESVPDYVTALEDAAQQLELVWTALRSGVPLDHPVYLRDAV